MTAAMNARPTDVAEMDLQLTLAAQGKIAELLAETDAEANMIRIFVDGGGCGGMSYGMTFSDGVTEYDTVLEGSGYKVAVDAVALNYLRGAEIDFTNDTFVFNNVFQSVGGSGSCGGCGGGGGGGGCGGSGGF